MPHCAQIPGSHSRYKTLPQYPWRIQSLNVPAYHPPFFQNRPNNDFFAGSFLTLRQRYPMVSSTLSSCSFVNASSLTMYASFFRWEEVTFRTLKFFLIMSFTCDSHIEHIIPSIFAVVIIMLLLPPL